MNKKYYEPKLKDKFDLKAKNGVLDLLLSVGFSINKPIEEQPEMYKKWDFVVQNKNGKDVFVECEVKTLWKEKGKWQSSLGEYIHVPYRKKDTQSDIICIVNNSLDTICIIPVDVLKKSDIIQKNTKNKFTGTTTVNEKFFSVDVKKCFLYYKSNNKWIMI